MRFTYDELKEYLRLVNKLYMLTSSFIKYYNDVIKQADRKYIHELSEDVRNLVLSGLKPDGEYTENAYALFVKDFTGLSIEDPKLYVSKLRLEAKPNVKVVVGKSQFIDFVQLLSSISEFIVNKVRELNLSNISTSINVKERDTKQESIEDLIAEIIKTSYDLSVGVNSFSTGVWGLRKITPHYMEKAYEDIPENLLRFLGFSKLINVKDYELWGFPDYFTKCTIRYTHKYSYTYTCLYICISINGLLTIPKLETLGGAICSLNEVVWSYIDLLYSTLSRWYKGVVNLRERYVDEAWKSLSEVGWSIPEYLEKDSGKCLYNDLEYVLKHNVLECSQSSPRFLKYDEGIITQYIEESCTCAEGCKSISNRLSQYITLPELFDDLMPAIFLGVVDITLYLNDKKALLILVRTKRGG